MGGHLDASRPTGPSAETFMRGELGDMTTWLRFADHFVRAAQIALAPSEFWGAPGHG